MNLVCFDTHILIWGVKQEAIPEQQEMILRAKHLIEKCEEQKKKILVPSIVVAELLIKVEPSKHERFIKLMEKRFIVPPFDVQAASYFAQIWQNNKQLRNSLMNDGVVTRKELKADSMIVATAVARKAWCIYSMDPHIKKFANGYVEVLDVPELPNEPTQLDLL